MQQQHQQQIYQQDQAGNQQANQQMLLCPVRLVYETQILVQPGDQIQPNQTILINPHNPPPWAQNRQVQNQVLYVQHMPNNFAPQTQQMDQNQLFVQNYGFQQIMPQMLAQAQEQRPLQITNMPNIVQQMPQQIGSNIQNERMNVQNYAMQQNQYVMQNQIPNVTRQIVSTAPKPINEIPKPPEAPVQNIYRQIVPQTVQQVNRPQLQQSVTMIPVQNMPTQRFGSIYDPNQIRPQQQVQQNMVQQYSNLMSNVQMDRKPPPVNVKTTSTVVLDPNNFNTKPQFTYRPIQPRPQQYRPSLQTPNVSHIQSNTGNIMLSNPHGIKNISSPIDPGNKIMPQNYVKDNTYFNRKRKSESPDEIQKKVSIHQIIPTTSNMIIKPVIPQQISSAEIGVNTSPVHKPDRKIPPNTMVINPISQNVKIKEELAKPVQITPKIQMEAPKMAKTEENVTEQVTLVRNTVFTQARGRLLNDKQSVQTTTNPNIVEVKQVEENKKEVKKKEEKTEIEKVKEEEKVEINITKRDHVEVKTETLEVNPKEEAVVVPVKANMLDKKEESNLSVSINNLRAKETCNELKLKEERDYVLTHVLDGYVIQESNIAFPIRKPLKEKIVYNTEDPQAKKEIKQDVTDIKVENDSKNKILEISQLHINENKPIVTKEDKEIKDDQPFGNLKQTLAKSWTVDQLSEYLSKYGWQETISVFQEHEIDGESLFLVTKNQLVQIGVKEEHANVICEYVKS